MSLCKYYNAAVAASLLSSASLNRMRATVSAGVLCPRAPIAQPPMMIKPTPKVAQSSHARHNQNSPICDTFFIINLIVCLLLAQWHNQKHTYCARTHARTRVSRFILLISIFDYLKKCLCHCAILILTRLCVCSTRMFLIVPSVPGGFCGI
jgi:hypothetical protein